MTGKLLEGKYNLLCVAHPDDESIFFGGLLLSRKNQKIPWLVVCVTSDGSRKRQRQFFRACGILGVAKAQFWGFADKFDQRLPIDAIVEKLKELPGPNEVFTHGVVGEYGHPHHQDVCYAVHRAFARHPKLFSVSYNAYPEMEVRLSPRDFETKSKILTKVYGSETNRFLNLLPSTFTEGFRRLDLDEVEAVYSYLAKKKPLKVRDLRAHKWLRDYLPYLRGLSRPF